MSATNEKHVWRYMLEGALYSPLIALISTSFTWPVYVLTYLKKRTGHMVEITVRIPIN